MLLNYLSALLLAITTFSHAQQLPLREPSEQEAVPVLSGASSRDLLSLHRELVSFESITGNEYEAGQALVDYLESKHFTVERQEVSHKRFNVLAYTGKNKYTKTLLTSHIDTVPPFIPYTHPPPTHAHPARISGRGTVDAKACVAAQIIAVRKLLSDKSLSFPSDALSLLFVVGEETGGDGMRAFSNTLAGSGHNYSTVIFGEPTEGKLASGHKGNLGFRVKVAGKAAHSGYPWLGVSANDVLIEALAILRKMADGRRLPSSEKYGNTTLNIGTIEGGVAANVVAEKAEANIAVRVAGGTPADSRKAVEDALAGVKKAAEGRGGRLEVVWGSEGYGPVDIDCDVKGFECITVNYGTDIPNLKGSHKRYLYGPGSILVAHGPNEGLEVKELERAVIDYEKLIKASLGM
ncbi:hypothetical protein W97_04245 [Coniosporium apollinis CBS 100218]|uniref:Peptidase M20 dimerisation domain-containing protein n=1 Tax=Coniosporium apollinis (strain CBS 100218) TaxID=1168221 RepID=R7YSZ1_CONA1|nr:uncharacterized protein W97_04245 [Coniosporium apollinis CBS 100218]EON65010.1 hypothetical protein W97_04245 [Coniosporium apollinis CBS 100218]